MPRDFYAETKACSECRCHIANDMVDEIERLRKALQDILDIETRLGAAMGLDMQSIARRALKK